MQSDRKNSDLERHEEQLKRDFAAMERLSTAIPDVIRFSTPNRTQSGPDQYTVDVSLRTIAKLGPFGTPVYIKTFKLEIILPKTYPARSEQRCSISPALFHPHVRIAQPLIPGLFQVMGKWIDPKGIERPQEDLASFVLRIIHTLRYEPDFVFVNPKTTGNHEALRWYQSWKDVVLENEVKLFPTDSTPLPAPGQDLATWGIEDPHEKTFKISGGQGLRHGDSTFVVESRGKSFKIESSTPPYRPVVKIFPKFGVKESADFRGSRNTHYLYLKPPAIQEIFEHIAWSKMTRENRVEQGGLLLGEAFKDPKTGLVYGVVEDAIPASSATGSGTYLSMGHQTWKEMLDELDEMKDSDPTLQRTVLGWYHTHPNLLDVFMSGTDARTQKLLFPQDWHFAVVFNPHRKIWRVFHGENCEECEGHLVKD